MLLSPITAKNQVSLLFLEESIIKDDLPCLFLRGSPVRVSDGGSYICLARNDLGSSDEITASVDVRYPARNVRTVPADFLDLEVRMCSSFLTMDQVTNIDSNPKCRLLKN
jgi:hypothetical protein